MSGRCAPSLVVRLTCSSKSQWALIPASSTTRRSCISPQRPRASGRRNAVTRACVWALSSSELRRAIVTCSARAAWDRSRAASESRNWASTRVSVCFSGSTSPSTAARRASSSPVALAFTALSRPSAISRKRRVLASRACADRAWNRSASCPSTKAVRCSAARARSSAALARAARSVRAPASRVLAARKPMTAPTSRPMTSVRREITVISAY